MEYKRFGRDAVIRLDPGDEILDSVRSFAEKESVTLASVSGIGASDDITLGIWNGGGYDSFHLGTTHEITSLCGNISVMNGKAYTHLHMTCAAENGSVSGGHLLGCVISLTAEIFVTILDDKLERKKNEVLGINALDFPGE